jgi:hypothetical protein
MTSQETNFSKIPLTFILIKAFGDFTIALSMLRQFSNSFNGEISLLIGEHLVGLCNGLNPSFNIKPLALGFDVPAIYDLKKMGILKGFLSLSKIRTEITKAMSNDLSTMVFDRFTWREFLIAQNNPYLVLPQTQPNIYLAYKSFFLNFGFSQDQPVYQTNRLVNEIGIFPYSRVPFKNIPLSIISSICNECSQKGFTPVVFVMDGELPIQLDGVKVVSISRNFNSLIEAIQSMRAIVSSDSLPAHLAEYFYKPIYVATPVANNYWLPEYSFHNGSWGIFSDSIGLNATFNHFLNSLN